MNTDELLFASNNEKITKEFKTFYPRKIGFFCLQLYQQGFILRLRFYDYFDSVFNSESSIMRSLKKFFSICDTQKINASTTKILQQQMKTI